MGENVGDLKSKSAAGIKKACEGDFGGLGRNREICTSAEILVQQGHDDWEYVAPSMSGGPTAWRDPEGTNWAVYFDTVK